MTSGKIAADLTSAGALSGKESFVARTDGRARNRSASISVPGVFGGTGGRGSFFYQEKAEETPPPMSAAGLPRMGRRMSMPSVSPVKPLVPVPEGRMSSRQSLSILFPEAMINEEEEKDDQEENGINCRSLNFELKCEHLAGAKSGKKSSKFVSKGKGCCNRPFHVGCAAYIDPVKANMPGRFYMDSKQLPNDEIHHVKVCPVHAQRYYQ